MKQGLVLICFVLLTQIVFAQQDKYAITIASGMSVNTVRDESATPLRSWAPNIWASLGFIEPSSEFEAQFSYGGLRNDRSAFPETVSQYRADINYREYINFEFMPEGSQIGLGWLTQGVLRNYPNFVNNFFQYDLASALSLEYRIQKDIITTSQGRILRLGWHASLPFVAATARPLYNTSIPEGFLAQDIGFISIFESMNITSLNRYWRFVSRVNFQFEYLNGNFMDFYYQWDIYRHVNPYLVFNATHQFGITLNFNTQRPQYE